MRLEICLDNHENQIDFIPDRDTIKKLINSIPPAKLSQKAKIIIRPEVQVYEDSKKNFLGYRVEVIIPTTVAHKLFHDKKIYR